MDFRATVLAGTLLAAISAFTLVPQRGAPPDLDKDPFKGVTTDGTVQPGLFAITSTGVTTAPVMKAAVAFIAALTPEQRKATTFPVDDSEWRRWNNIRCASRAR